MDHPTWTRREFLQLGLGALTALLTPPFLPDDANLLAHWLSKKAAMLPGAEPPPATLGRIISWYQQAVRQEPSPKAPVVAWKNHDTVIPLYSAVAGDPPWPTNPIWYQTEEGYIHSGFVQPVENNRQTEVLTDIAPPGFWAEVSVPYAEARQQPGGPYVLRRLYYQTVYRVIAATRDAAGEWWYRLQEGITWSPGPYVPSWSVRRIAPAELTPISPGRADKWIQIDIRNQMLTCYEGEQPVFSTAIASGTARTPTPLGEFRILYKRHTRRMVGEDYDLTGVPFPTYFTRSGVAIHGTYWHNDYGRRYSHGCLNVPSRAALWVFRWTDPQVPYELETLDAPPNTGTRVVVS